MIDFRYNYQILYLSNNKRKSAGGDEGLINDFTINVTKSEFEEKISSFISQMRMLCESTIDEANIKIQDINELLGIHFVNGNFMNEKQAEISFELVNNGIKII